MQVTSAHNQLRRYMLAHQMRVGGPSQAPAAPQAPVAASSTYVPLGNTSLLDSFVSAIHRFWDWLTGTPQQKPAKQPTKTKHAPKHPHPAPAPLPHVPTNTKAFFISQYAGPYNLHEDAPHNGNCGPTSLTMCAEAFGKVKVTPATANAAIEATRRRMGAGTTQSSEYDGTSYTQLQQGARSYGLTAKVLYGKLDAIKAELAKGRLVIAHVRPSYLWSWSTSGHYTVVTKIQGNKVYLNDPANPSGPIVISAAAFLKGQAGRGTYGLISVGP